MERRSFLKALVAGSAASVPALPVLAGEPSAALGRTPPILLVCQSDLPAAATLGAALAAALRQAGAPQARRIDLPPGELRTLAGIDAALAEGRPGRIVGLMDDASAVLFQEVAATRGHGTLWQARHGMGDDGVRHCCQPTGLAGALVWRAAPGGWEAPLARLYADLLTGRALQAPGRPHPPAAGHAAHDAMVSFVLKA